MSNTDAILMGADSAGGESVSFMADSTDPERKGPAKFQMLAYTGGKMVPVGRNVDFVVDLAGLSWPAKGVPARLNHSADQGVGFIDRVEQDGKSLQAYGRITRKTPAAMDVLDSAKDGHPWQASIFVRFSREDTEEVPAGESRKVNGRTIDGPFIHVQSSRLGEISFVDAGADPETLTQIAAAMQGTHTMPKTKTDDNPDTQTQSSNTATLAASAASSPSGGGDREFPDWLAEAQERAQNEDRIERRCKEIVRINPRLHAEVASLRCAAIDGDMNMKDFNRNADSLMQRLPMNPAQSQVQNHAEVIEAAMCMTEMLPNLEKYFDEKTLDQASKRFKNGCGPRQAMFEAAKINGNRDVSERDIPAMMNAAFRSSGYDHLAASSASTINLPELLSNVANKFAAQAFLSDEEDQQNWRYVAAIRSVRDYKENTLVSIGLNQGMQELAPGGEIQSTTPLETSYKVTAKTFASMLRINHEQLANDDLGEFVRLSQEFAANALDHLSRQVWTSFMATTGNFFHADKGNLYEDAAAGLSIDSFGVLRTLIRKQTKPNGEPLNFRPRFLIHPPELTGIATQLQSTLTIPVGQGSTAKVQGANNPWAGTFQPVESTWLSNTTITNNSTKAWYLVTNPEKLASVVVAFLNGRQTPVIETAQADFTSYGIQMRARFDHGVNKMEYRAAAKSKGEA